MLFRRHDTDRPDPLVSQGRRSLDRARRALERGRMGTAIRHGWSAAQDGALAGNANLLAEARQLGVAAGDPERAKPKDAREAERLVRYCDELADQQRAGVKPAGLLDGLFSLRRERTKTCPDCAETIKIDARVCRFCGYRYPPTGG